MTVKAAAPEWRGRPDLSTLIAALRREVFIRAASAALACVAVWLFIPRADAGHEIAYYPSFYPQEITVETVDPASAAERLTKSDLHAYVGARPKFTGAVPEHLQPVESLDGFLLLEFDPASEKYSDRESRCTAGRAVTQSLKSKVEDVVLASYPVTPFHPDYLHHFDRIESANTALSESRLEDPNLEALAEGEHRDVRLERVSLNALVSDTRLPASDQPAPPWRRQGWYQAYQLLYPGVVDTTLKKNIDAAYQRLTKGEYRDPVERLNLERRLVADLVIECRRIVTGYTVRTEYYTGDPSGGIENVAYDGQTGMNSPVFVRTAKLKDFPWNGWLFLGTRSSAKAAWNPVAGFTDPSGGLIWSAVGDPALLDLPYNGSFIPNRVSGDVVLSSTGSFNVPPAALSFEPGSGEIRLTGAGRTSSAKITYRVNASVFQDGSKTEVSDLIYAYVFAFRWGERLNAGDPAYDSAVDAATALMRERLVGIKVIKVDSKTTELAPDVKYTRETPLIEVYLNHGSGDSLNLAAIAPPWSAVPWHLSALMEEAVVRGLAAFSQSEARRKNVPWLDLARDENLKVKLRELIDEFERQGHRPEALELRVSKEEARARWRALNAFAEANNHLLVTNGPYKLKTWADGKAVVGVVRELTYPWGVGAFDGYTDPPRAIIVKAERTRDTIALAVDLEKVVKAQRRYETVREPFGREATRGLFRIRPSTEFLLLDSEGAVIHVGEAALIEDGRFEVKLPEGLGNGRHQVLIGIFPDGNALRPAVIRVAFEAGT